MKPSLTFSENPWGARRLAQALTLLELLIVVAILAILTTVATRSLLQVGEQVQFDANQDLAKNFRLALLGPPGAIQSDGTPSVSGFIADLARPPRAQLETYSTGENVSLGGAGVGTAYSVRELMENTYALPFKSYPTDSTTVTSTTKLFSTFTHNLYDLTNRLTFGWRGPYLTGGSDSVVDDGWNKPLAAYAAPANRNLIDFWVTTYDGNASPAPVMNPFTFSVAGYHSMDAPFNGRFWYDVVGIVVRPGPASVNNVYTSTALDNYTNSLSAGVAFDNEYTAQLGCVLNYNQNAMTDPSFINGTYNSSYWFVAGVIMYSPNPYYYGGATPLNGPAQFSSSAALTKSVAVSLQATGASISSTGPSSSTYPTAQILTITNNIIEFNPSSGAPTSASSYPLIQGPKVVKPFLVALRKSSGFNVNAVIVSTNWYGTARSIILRPGYNTVQLTVP